MLVSYILVGALLGVFGVFTYFHFRPDAAYRTYVGSSTDRHLRAVEGPEAEDKATAAPPHVW